MNIKTDRATLRKIEDLLDGGDKQKYLAQALLAKKIFEHCADKGFDLSIERTTYKLPSSPLPTSFYLWNVKDQKGKLIAKFEISRNIWPKSARSSKGREFLFFANLITMVNHG